MEFLRAFGCHVCWWFPRRLAGSGAASNACESAAGDSACWRCPCGPGRPFRSGTNPAALAQRFRRDVCNLPQCGTRQTLPAAAKEASGELAALRGSLSSGSHSTSSVRQVIDRDRLAVWHPYTALGDIDEPLVCVGAQDEFLDLADGRRVIDAISSWWTILHGHRHPPLMDALAEAARKFDHVLFAGVTHVPAVELADLLLGTMPWPDGRVFYSDNGSTAVEVALKMAYQFWCHQGSPSAPALSASSTAIMATPSGPWRSAATRCFLAVSSRFCFRPTFCRFDPDRLDADLCAPCRARAAVIVEPLVQGAGGMRMHRPAKLRQLAECRPRHGVLFIADEVMTGGRTGSLWPHIRGGRP